jgi:tetratricopeptide (TPR) repeat protein
LVAAVLKEQGNHSRALDSFRRAREVFARGAAAFPNDTTWRVGLADYNESIAEVLLTQGEKTEAMQVYEESVGIRLELVQIDRSNIKWRTALVDCLDKYSQLQRVAVDNDAALATYDHIIETAPDTPALYNDRGVLHDQMGQSDKALADFDKAISLEPNYALAHSNRGYILAAQGQHAAAIAAFTEAVRLEPDNAGWRNARGTSFNETQQYNEAIADFDEALRLNSDLVDAIKNRARAYWLKGDLDKALTDYESVLRTTPDDLEALTDHGSVLKDKGDYDRALIDYNKVVATRLAKVDHGDIDAQRDLAAAYEKVGDLQVLQSHKSQALMNYKEALVIYRLLVEADKGNGESLTNLAAGLYKLAVASTGDEKDAAIKEALSILDRLDSTGQLTADRKTWRNDFIDLRDASRRGWLGLAVQGVGKEIALSLHLENTRGLLIAMVAPNSPAARSGFEVGDVIVSIDGASMQDAAAFLQILSEIDAGQNVIVTVLRDGNLRRFHVTLGELGTQSAPTAAVIETYFHAEGAEVADGETTESATENFGAHFFDGYFEDLVTSQR